MNPREGIHSWFGDDLKHRSKPCRVLLWLTAAPASWTLAKIWIHPYLLYEAVIAQGEEVPEKITQVSKVYKISPCHSIKQLVQEIDAGDMLPLDFIITPTIDPDLAAAASSASIPLIYAS
jgi:hypothetical protein